MLPSLFICRDFFSFCPINHVGAHLQAPGLLEELQWVQALGWRHKKRKIPTNKGGCGNTTPLSLRKFPLWKIVVPPWKREKVDLRSTKLFVWSCFSLHAKSTSIKIPHDTCKKIRQKWRLNEFGKEKTFTWN